MINLYWFKYLKGQGNFGDELNPYLLASMTDTSFRYINVKLLNNNKRQALKTLLSHLWHKKITFGQLARYIFYNFISRPSVFLCIGSILDHCNYNNVLIWGSGIISNNSRVPNGRYLAVRGFKSQERVNTVGLACSDIVGDPAILLPIIYKSSYTKKYKVGIIPHVTHYGTIKSLFTVPGVVVIDLSTEIEKIIDVINQCELTISTSLHGIIISQAYNVRSVWAKLYNFRLSGDDVKYADYFSSVNIDLYEPIDIDSLRGFTVEELTKKVLTEYSDYLLPTKRRIADVQNDLLKTFPFPLKENLKKMLR